ncbi:MAG: right-handed parallel beta-helix repeat-containing protein, partial [Candidatus Thermoplasmatota archaeon]
MGIPRPRAYSRALVVEVLVMMLLVSIFAVGVRVVRGATEARATESGLTPHAPIYISGNSGFTAANGVVAGNGTKENPYIIEGWEINASSTNGIEIRNTDAHFIIRKCYIYGGKSNYEGIYFKNVRNGIITNTVLKENFRGAYFLLCSNNTILNCNMSNNHWG